MIRRITSNLQLGTLRGRLIISVAVVHAVMMTLFIIDLTIRQRAIILDRQVEEATALSQALATSAAGWITSNDISGLQELVDAQRRYPEIIFAILTNEQGRVLADIGQSKLGYYMLDLPREPKQTVLSKTPSLVDVATPAIIAGRHVGWARVGIGQKVAISKLAVITRSGIVYALAAILTGSIIAWFMGRRITLRLYSVLKAIFEVRSGNRLARAKIVGTDEAAIIAREFNSMLDALTNREVELRASEERYRSLIQKVQTAIVLHDDQGRILNSNFLAHKLLGLSEEQLLGKELIDPAWHFLREDGSILGVSEYPARLVMSTNKPLRNYTCGISSPEMESITWVLLNAEPEYDNTGKLTQVIVSFVDITELKRIEEELSRYREHLEESVETRTKELSESNRQLQIAKELAESANYAKSRRTAQLEVANKELEAFAYSVSHDLRSPLRHIDGFLELLQKRIEAGLDEQSRHYMITITNSARQMESLIDDLLSFSRLGRNAMSEQQVDLGALVREVIRDLAPDTTGRNIHWQIGELPEVTGDRSMLRMVLVNLISNALKFTKPCGEARIEIGCLSGMEAEHEIYVRDNGVGFDMTYVDRLFNVFQRLHRADEFEGTGIGLANVRRIISRHGGRTWAKGEINQGATFYFSLPQSIQGR